MLRTLFSLASSAYAASRVRSAALTLSRTLVLGIIALMLISGAIIFTSMAAYMWVAESFEPKMAALIMAGNLTFVAIVVGGLIYAAQHQSQPKSPVENALSQFQSAIPSPDDVSHRMRKLTKRHGMVPVVGGAVAAGAVLALLVSRLS